MADKRFYYCPYCFAVYEFRYYPNVVMRCKELRCGQQLLLQEGREERLRNGPPLQEADVQLTIDSIEDLLRSLK